MCIHCYCVRVAGDRRIIEDGEDDDDDHDGNWPRYPYTHVRDLHRQGHSPRVLTAVCRYGGRAAAAASTS